MEIRLVTTPVAFRKPQVGDIFGFKVDGKQEFRQIVSTKGCYYGLLILQTQKPGLRNYQVVDTNPNIIDLVEGYYDEVGFQWFSASTLHLTKADDIK